MNTMATVAAPPAQRKVILRGVSWETYQRLLNEHQEVSGTHFIYDQGSLEIMVLSADHEEPNRILAQVVELIVEEWQIDIRQLGSTTFQREDLEKGFEPDSAYYIAHASDVEGRRIDPATDPPPDLIIEVDVTSPSLPRFPIFAAFGVPEVWRYDGSRVAIHRLEGDRYVEANSSLAFPPLTAETITRFLGDRQRLRSTQWVRQIREWARRQR
jgi:Uma2 family endonuclease